MNEPGGKTVEKKRWANLRRLLGYVKPYWKLLAVSMVLAVVVSAANGATAWLVKPVLDDIFLKKDAHMLSILPLAILLVFFVKGVSGYGQSYFIQLVGRRVVRDLRNELYAAIQRMPLSFFHRTPSAVLMSRITNDVQRLSRVSSSVISDFIRGIFTMAALIFIIFYRDWFLATISMAVLPLAYFPFVIIGRRVRNLSRRSQERMAALMNVMQEGLTGIKVVKAFGMEEYEKKRFREANQQLFRMKMKEVRTGEVLSPLMEFLGSIGTAGVIFYGGYKVINGVTTPGTFFSFLTALMMLYGPIRQMSRISNSVQQAMAAAERVFQILDMKPELVDSPGAVPMSRLTKGISFKNVSFSYDAGARMVLKNINLDIEKGEMVALVGMSGAGKTTLCDLMARFYDVTEGRIEIDGRDIREYTIASLRDNIGIVTQETVLFNDTVAKNIAYGAKDTDMKSIIDAAKAAYAHDFVMEMPEGYDTVIGERGVRLSGGQRQRISIARAILKNPQILILDEATSELDGESELMVQKALENLMKDRTTFVIAHRLATVIRADRIVVIDEGRVVDIGRHQDLLQRNEIYRRLFESQFLMPEDHAAGN